MSRSRNGLTSAMSCAPGALLGAHWSAMPVVPWAQERTGRPPSGTVAVGHHDDAADRDVVALERLGVVQDAQTVPSTSSPSTSWYGDDVAGLAGLEVLRQRVEVVGGRQLLEPSVVVVDVVVGRRWSARVVGARRWRARQDGDEGEGAQSGHAEACAAFHHVSVVAVSRNASGLSSWVSTLGLEPEALEVSNRTGDTVVGVGLACVEHVVVVHELHVSWLAAASRGGTPDRRTWRRRGPSPRPPTALGTGASAWRRAARM